MAIQKKHGINKMSNEAENLNRKLKKKKENESYENGSILSNFFFVEFLVLLANRMNYYEQKFY